MLRTKWKGTKTDDNKKKSNWLHAINIMNTNVRTWHSVANFLFVSYILNTSAKTANSHETVESIGHEWITSTISEHDFWNAAILFTFCYSQLGLCLIRSTWFSICYSNGRSWIEEFAKGPNKERKKKEQEEKKEERKKEWKKENGKYISIVVNLRLWRRRKRCHYLLRMSAVKKEWSPIISLLCYTHMTCSYNI